MKKSLLTVLIVFLIVSCNQSDRFEIDRDILHSLGAKYKNEFYEMALDFEKQVKEDAMDVSSYLGLADSYILLYVFGYMPRNETMPEIKTAYEKASIIDSSNSDVVKLSAIISFLDWKWEEAGNTFRKAIRLDPENLNARHWYALWLAAMGDFEGAMAQSDSIMTMDKNDDYLISRASFLYFQYRFEEMIPLMAKSIEKDPTVPWAYDWLGMAYNGIEDHENSLKTYFDAFELSDGTVEVGGGLGHALGHAGEIKLAKQMADYYEIAARDHYLPPVQRSFIHLGMGENSKALELLEQAYREQSWFLIFIQVEHWYDPLRKEPRFLEITDQMKFPQTNKGEH